MRVNTTFRWGRCIACHIERQAMNLGYLTTLIVRVPRSVMAVMK